MPAKSRSLAALLLLLVILIGCSEDKLPSFPRVDPDSEVKTWTAVIIAIYPHDTQAFTQGLFYKDGLLYESTGRYGQSSLRRVELASGVVIESRPVGNPYFAEGLVEKDGKLVQLTWQARQAFVYDAATFTPLDTLSYTGEGWGLTTDSSRYIMSNGSSTITFRDNNFAATREINVQLDGLPVTRLNELEYVEGEIYANVWKEDYIVIISPQTGAVTGIVDCSDLIRMAGDRGSEGVLNGIAWDPQTGRLFLTGKLWPFVFQVELSATLSAGPTITGLH